MTDKGHPLHPQNANCLPLVDCWWEWVVCRAAACAPAAPPRPSSPPLAPLGLGDLVGDSVGAGPRRAYASEMGCGAAGDGVPSRWCSDGLGCGGRRAGVRCCTDPPGTHHSGGTHGGTDGGTDGDGSRTHCTSHCSGSEGAFVSLSDAVLLCARRGERLCTREELRSACCGQQVRGLTWLDVT